MSSAINEPLQEILSEYSIEVLGISCESYKDKKGVWWIDTSDGYKVLKKISNSEDTLKFIISAIRHLTKNGINIPEIIKTKDSEDYANINGSCYILSQAVDGKNPSYDVHRQLEAVVKELARFHKASVGFFPVSSSKPKIHLGTWVDAYTRQIENMNDFYREGLSIETKDDIEKFISNEFPAFYSRAQKAIDGLRGKYYADWVDKAETTGSLCHQDFAAGNLLLLPAGKIYVIDTDSITIDIPARDIRKLLNKIMKKRGEWDSELTKNIFSFYQAVNPLTPSEWHIVKLDLTFPHLFVGAMNKYYYKREKKWTTESYFKRIKEVTAIEKTITSILENFESLIPR